MTWLSEPAWAAVKSRVSAHANWAEQIEWQNKVKRPEDATVFAMEACWVILSSGMAPSIAKKTWARILKALESDRPIPFDHIGKREAMARIWTYRENFWDSAIDLSDEDLVEWCGRLPWVGGVAKYDLAKSLGVDVVKPDLWISRLADALGKTPDEVCRGIADAYGERLSTVDLIFSVALSEGLYCVEEFIEMAR